jgi:hypothetical protein
MAEEESEVDVPYLDLDWDFIQHCVIPESFDHFRTEQFNDALIANDELALKVWRFQNAHRREHGQIATASVIEDEFDEVTIQEPLSAVADLVSRLRVRYVRNTGMDIVESIAKATVEDPLSVGKKMLSEGRALIQIVENRGESYGPDDHDQAVKIYDEEMTKGFGPSFGFPAIDQHFHGQRGISVLLAPPKGYKSWFGVNAADSEINLGGFPYIDSLELPANDTHWRLKCLQADIPYWKYLHGSLDTEDFEHLQSISTIMEQNGRYRIDKPPFGQRSPEQLVEKALNVDATCLIIDQLQYVEAPRNGQSLGALNKTGDYWDVLNIFRDYSDMIPIFIIHQFNRTVLGVDGMPEMQQAKGSSAIEEVASQALAIWSTKDMRRSGLVNIGTNFSRHHNHAAWEVSVELTKGCRFTLNEEIDDWDDDDED